MPGTIPTLRSAALNNLLADVMSKCILKLKTEIWKNFQKAPYDVVLFLIIFNMNSRMLHRLSQIHRYFPVNFAKFLRTFSL